MGLAVRYRKIESPKATYGTFTRVTSSGTTSSSQSGLIDGVIKECDDTCGFRHKTNFLQIKKYEHHVSPLNGKRPHVSIPTTYSELKNWVILGANALGHLPIPGELSESDAGVSGLSRSKPDNPAVNLPLFAKELGDLPRMLRTMGVEVSNSSKNGRKKRRRGLVKPDTNLGSQYLNQVFGWDPLFRDLQKLLQFKAITDAKAKELKNMYNNGGIRRRVELSGGFNSSSDDNYTVFSGTSTLVNRRRFTSTSLRRWMVVRWIPTHIPKDMSNPALHKLASSIAFGGRQNAADAWNAIPWSWLADWSGNMGDYLNIHTNRTPLMLGTACLMTHRSTIETWSYPLQPDLISGGVGFRLLDNKRRIAYYPPALPTAHIPFLGGGQLAILGSLAVSGKRR